MIHRVHPIVARQFPRLASRLSPPGKVSAPRVRTCPPPFGGAHPDVVSADPALSHLSSLGPVLRLSASLP